jgi:phosphoribosylformylglycinamidine (FGAM) synthase-like amidotransferase family enzyme
MMEWIKQDFEWFEERSTSCNGFSVMCAGKSGILEEKMVLLKSEIQRFNRRSSHTDRVNSLETFTRRGAQKVVSFALEMGFLNEKMATLDSGDPAL